MGEGKGRGRGREGEGRGRGGGGEEEGRRMGRRGGEEGGVERMFNLCLEWEDCLPVQGGAEGGGWRKWKGHKCASAANSMFV